MRLIPCLVMLCVLLWTAPPLFCAASGLDAAQTLLVDQRGSEAYQAVQEHLRLHPGDPQGLFLKGLILEHLGRFTEAMDVYRELIRNHPELPEPYNNLAGLLASSGRFDEAKETLQRALETHPSYATAHQNLTRIYSAMASSAYRRVLGKDDQRILVHLDPLEELSSTPETLSPAPSAPVATVARESEPEFDLVSVLAPSTTSVAEWAPETTSGPSPAPHPELHPEPTTASLPEPLTPQPAQPEPMIVPAPEPFPAPTSPDPPNVAPPVIQPTPEEVTEPLPEESEDADTTEEIISTVLAWAKAWESQNVEAYLGFYSGNFRPERGLTLAQWRDQRRTRVAAPAFINVALSDIVVTFDGENVAQVRFAQRYRSNVINDQVRKELLMHEEDGQWRIVRERLLPRS
ncbi:nuclear transport factor 2 family protein [Desulfonatronum thioautotrophicum]|uniref:nuclear transport factor 2 family protein n=1 Tax=Desulfonatronum thioautotrophicum TaxID=617001 RepID=UPI0005EAD0AE|nr:nuclear transport factor 2 family protein [Desulfonatronum thioautotrophicum]